jgi:hypothetical protein
VSEPKRYTGKTEGSTLGSPHWEHPEGEWVKWEDYARLKAECQARQAENSVLAVECDSLKAEVERLKGIILAQSSEFVRNATKQEEEPLPDGWNSSVAKACDLLAEKDKDYARLKAEVEKWEFIHRLDSLAIKKQKEEIERLNEAIVRGAIIPDPKPE